jgi:cytochrome c oxidase cbb3-type subunit 2
MRGLAPLFLGLFGTFAFSWVGLTVIPNIQIGHLEPQSDEEGTDVYPVPQSGMVERGRHVYVANGCFYCHSQQVRADYAAADIDRKFGERRSAPRDYIFQRPVQLGKERMGPDLSNEGKRSPPAEESPAPANAPAPAPAGTGSPAASPSPAPPTSPNASPPSAAPAASPAAVASAAASPAPNAGGVPQPYTAAWHHRHLYSPRSISPDLIDSNMPAYRFLYQKRLIGAERSVDALQLDGPERPPAGWEIVPTYDAKCLVAYLMSLDQSHPLKEVKSSAAPASLAAPAAPAKGAK